MYALKWKVEVIVCKLKPANVISEANDFGAGKYIARPVVYSIEGNDALKSNYQQVQHKEVLKTVIMPVHSHTPLRVPTNQSRCKGNVHR